MEEETCLKVLRNKHNLTQKQLAEQLGIINENSDETEVRNAIRRIIRAEAEGSKRALPMFVDVCEVLGESFIFYDGEFQIVEPIDAVKLINNSEMKNENNENEALTEKNIALAKENEVVPEKNENLARRSNIEKKSIQLLEKICAYLAFINGHIFLALFVFFDKSSWDALFRSGFGFLSVSVLFVIYVGLNKQRKSDMAFAVICVTIDAIICNNINIYMFPTLLLILFEGVFICSQIANNEEAQKGKGISIYYNLNLKKVVCLLAKELRAHTSKREKIISISNIANEIVNFVCGISVILLSVSLVAYNVWMVISIGI